MPLSVYRQQTGARSVALPRASTPMLVDPSGEALVRLTDQLTDLGLGIRRAQLEADVSDRVGRMTAELNDLETEVEKDADFRTAPDRFKDGSKGIKEKYLEGIDHAGAKLAITKHYQQLEAAKYLNVQKATLAKQKDYNIATLDSNLDLYAKSAAEAGNPVERGLIISNARLSLSTAQAGGWITAEDAGKRERRFLGKIDDATVLRDMQINPRITADKLSLDPSYAANIDPVQRERYIDRAYRQAEADRKATEAEAERFRRERGEELLKDAYKRQTTGTLTPNHLEAIKPFISPAEYRSLLKGDGDRKDDPNAFADLQRLLDTNPAEARNKAFQYHANNLITNATLASVRTSAGAREQNGVPKTEFERSRAYIGHVLDPGPFSSDPAPKARYGLALREYEDFAADGKRSDEDLRKKANEVVKRYALLDMEALATSTGLGAQTDPKKVIDANMAEGEKLMQRRAAGAISEQDFKKRMEELNRSTKAAEKALNARTE